MESSSPKRPRDAAGEPGASPEADDESTNKRLRPQDLLDMLDDEADAAAAGDLASVMRSLEEEIGPSGVDDEAAAAAGDISSAPQPELGFLLEASDDELGLPPAAAPASTSSEDAGEPETAVGLDDQLWGFEDEIPGGGSGGYSPEAAAAIAAAAAAAWDDDGFDAGLFAFDDGPSDLAALRQETMPAV